MPWNPEGRLVLKARDLMTATDTGYERDTNVIRFGSIDRMGYEVPTALFRDIVAHEVTHAILDGFRPAWGDAMATTEQIALHEALADLVAILSVFSSREVAYRQLEAAAGGLGAGQEVDEAVMMRSIFDFARDLCARGPLLAYMPPVDVSWHDLLRGVVASDLDMVPEDQHGYREALQTEFSGIGIHRVSLSNISGVDNYQGLRYPVRLTALGSDPQEVQRFVWENPRLLDAARLERRTPLSSTRVRTSERVTPDGFVVSEIGASFIQTVRMSRKEAFVRLGLKTKRDYVDIRGGGVLRFDAGGRLVYAALKPVMSRERQAALFVSDEQRAAEQEASDGVQNKFHRTGE